MSLPESNLPLAPLMTLAEHGAAAEAIGSEQAPREERWSRLLSEAAAGRIAGWLEAGKVDEADLDAVLTPDARAFVDAGVIGNPWTAQRDLESMIQLISQQLGGDPGLVEWAPDVLSGWAEEEPFVSTLEEAARLVDGAGYAVGSLAGQLCRDADWSYCGGRRRFEVRWVGLADVSTGLLSLLGALLRGAALRASSRFEDVRFEGVDEGRLVVFSEGSSRGSEARFA